MTDVLHTPQVPDPSASFLDPTNGDRGKLLRAFNDQAAVECCGYAVDGDVLVMLDVVGHKTACKSIWATTVSNPRRHFGISDGVSVRGGDVTRDKYRAFWIELPEQNAHNLLICHNRVLDALTDPGDVQPFYVIEQGGTQAHSAKVATPAHRFAAMLNQALELPILNEWAKSLWDQGLAAELITEIRCGGDVVSAYRIWPAGDPWAKIVQDCLGNNVIAIPQS